jgi:glutathione S-transferase
MSELILHHYDTSPFSEKVRKVLALKRLRWQAVEQPNMMPKPDLVPLTGGYRRIPVLQIGADVYCDTQLIVRTLERLHPTPTLYPGGSEGTCHAWNLWADRLVFLPAVAVVFAEVGHLLPEEFLEDRSKMIPGRDFGREVREQAPHAREQLRALLATIEVQLADGRPYLLGREASLADAAAYHPVWFLGVAPGAAVLLEEFPALRAWKARVEALGEGERRAMAPGEALAIARASRPAPVPAPATDPREPNRLAAGTRVSVVPDDYGFDPVTGELASSSGHEVAVRRRDPALGEVVVHFPRFGFRVTRSG